MIDKSLQLRSASVGGLNLQDPEKPIFNEDGRLEVHSIWNTIQGEGPFSGAPATFIRLAGCNLQCSYCDTEYTNRTKMDLGQIANRLLELTTMKRTQPLVVITGGEPFRQRLRPLIDMLIRAQRHVQIETNGTLSPRDVRFKHERQTIVCSPKTPEVNKIIWKYATHAKYVVKSDRIDSRDGLPTKSVGFQYAPPARPPDSMSRENIFVQPLDEFDPEKNKRNQQAAVASCLEFGYRLSLQIHKIVGVE